jgi:hypothetical protein
VKKLPKVFSPNLYLAESWFFLYQQKEIMYFVVNGLQDYIPVMVEAKNLDELEKIVKEIFDVDNFKVVALFKNIPEAPDYPCFYFER